MLRQYWSSYQGTHEIQPKNPQNQHIIFTLICLASTGQKASWLELGSCGPAPTIRTDLPSPAARYLDPPTTAFGSRLADAFVIGLSLWAATALRGISWADRYTMAAAVAVLAFQFFGERRQLYRSWSGTSAYRYLWPVLAAWAWTGFALFVVAWAMKSTDHYSRVAIGLWAVLGLSGLVSWRIVQHALLGPALARRRGIRRTAIAIAGAGNRAAHFAHLVAGTPSLGLAVAGFFADSDAGSEPGAELPAAVLGDLDALVERARAREFDHVYITLPMKAEERIRRLVTELSDTGVATYIVPDLFIHDLAHAFWTDVGSVPVISVFEAPFSGSNAWVKRLEDLVLSIVILAASALPMVLIAAAVKATSPGPVLFRQVRNGFDGRRITVWKFRTMHVQEHDDGDVAQAVRDDARLTPIGAMLRRTSLDELPQFFNVLGGEMSVVGPRPHATAHNERYRRLIPGYMLRHRVKPGITGWAQIHGLRGRTDTLDKMEQRIKYDLWYIRRWSVWLDLWIVARSAMFLFGDDNAW